MLLLLACLQVGPHWAYAKPVRPEPPTGGCSPIDAFIRDRLRREGLAPAPEASRETLIRRVSLDLVGLPPSLEEIDAFVADPGADAYEKLVDRLLASPRYGERWARPWLDLARYADTNGFNIDSRRTMWKYRDWVIRALNADMPYTQFTIEQIAGDMLPDATLDQKVATGFNRNTLTNEEGGVDKEEARWETLLDRVNTTATVWLGTTLACAQCHDHKFDPFTQREYYRFLAFFDNSDEPKIELLTPGQMEERRAVREAIGREEKALRASGEHPLHVQKALETAFEKRSSTLRHDVLQYCRSPREHAKEIGARLLELTAAYERFDGTTALVLQERRTADPPSTHVHKRGSYTNVGEKVTAGVPAALPPLPEGVRPDRLALARWLVDANNPLTARVAVNRFWDTLFGRPLVETPEDFGTQGPPPVHRELLDWLATEFVRAGWSMKSIHKTIVMSETYRQSSRVTPALLEKDPANRFYARGPRHRVEAEMVRDILLSAGGLLSPKIGGPSVFPLQADTSGVVAINKVDTSWTPSGGEDRHRRGLYTHWRRTAPFVAFATFDAPTRECCTVRRPRTNTPLQALAGLNDPAYFEAARGLARRVLAEAGPDARERAVLAFRLATGRRPDAVELDRLVAAAERDADWVLIANVLLNLDETLTKE